MNIEQAVEHGRAWVAAGWTWERGQVALAEDYDGEWRVMLVTAVADGRPLLHGIALPPSAVPDMRDRGTLGHALGQVREAWCEPLLVTHAEDDECDVVWTARIPLRFGSRWLGRGPTEAEALLAARRAAP